MQSDYEYLKSRHLSRLQTFPSSVRKPLQHNRNFKDNECLEKGYLKYLKEILYDFVDTFAVHGLDRVIKSSWCSLKR